MVVNKVVLPDATLGILGGGQLGRMFTVAARTMGYKVIVLDPDPHSPAAELANEHICASFTDRAALEKLGRACAAITTEFENVDAASMEFLAQFCPVRPSGKAVAIAQNRIREKTFLRDNGFDTAPFAEISIKSDIEAALKNIGTPALLKTSQFGYDGKGQATVNTLADALAAFEQMGNKPCVLEQRLNLKTEISVVVARDVNGNTVAYPAAENTHVNGILDLSIVPALVSDQLAQQATRDAQAVAKKLDYCGVMAVEFFVVENDRLLINEIAPRPHNSGHYTMDACLTSQFDQQVRAMCGLPLGDARLLAPVAMVNILGDAWPVNGVPAWDALLNEPRAKLHLYGKREARPGRKMGHFTCIGDSVQEASTLARELQQKLQG
ncbi:MAG: 5-(carboxyamino)imidazole ribonucleotide synthase [Gallionellaceae bacterium]|jgi:5-(carboxyamino)imidazole ribonucleotide synthase